jgi:hypothetical protein
MKLKECVIGETFQTDSGAFRCTDIGTRVVVATKLGLRSITRAQKVDDAWQYSTRMNADPSWLNGPPYAVEEVVFYEYDLPACFRTEAELKEDRAET